MRTALALIVPLAGLALPALADPPSPEPDGTALVQSRLLAERDAVEIGGRFRVAARFRIEPGWHIYWKNPGDSGMPTSIKVVGPEGVTIERVDWPVPEVFSTPDETTIGYSGEAGLILTLRAPADLDSARPLDLKIEANWLVCKEICLMGSRPMDLRLPLVAAGDPKLQVPANEGFVGLLGRLPGSASDLGLETGLDGSELRIRIPAADGSRVRFLPFETRGVRFGPGPVLDAVAKDGKADIRIPLRIEPDPSAEGPRTLGGLVTVTGPDGNAQSAEFTLPVPEPTTTPASR
jgi:DsbC/DsbD-like thiol-disulfide interchange protein